MRDGLRARAFRSAAPATCLDCAASTYRSVSLSRWFSRSVSTASWEVRMALTRWVGRAIGLDVHREFCVVAICEGGQVRSGARVASTPEGLQLLAQSLVKSDRVVLEVTGSCWEVARILGPRVDPPSADPPRPAAAVPTRSDSAALVSRSAAIDSRRCAAILTS